MRWKRRTPQIVSFGTMPGFLTRCVQRLLEWRECLLRDSQLVRQSREGTGGSIAEAAQRRKQRRQQDMDPLVGFALAHAEQPPLSHLNGVGLQVGEQEEQAIFRGSMAKCGRRSR